MSNKVFSLEDEFNHTYVVVAKDFTQAIQKFDCFAKKIDNSLIIVGDLKSISISDVKLVEADDSEEQPIKTETK